MNAPPAGCAALIAAAGLSRRMGRWKGALPWQGGRTLLEAHAAAMGGVADAGVWCAIPAGFAEVGLPDLVADARPHLVEVDDREAPQFASLRLLIDAARTALDAGLTRALFTPVDAPPASAAVLAALAAAAHDSPDAWVVRPVLHDPAANRLRSGHPLLLARAALDDLLALDPATARLDVYIRSLAPERRADVPVRDPRILANMNTPEEYDRLRANAPS